MLTLVALILKLPILYIIYLRLCNDLIMYHLHKIVYLQNSLYFKCAPRKQSELLIIDAETLIVTGIAVLEGKDWSSSVMFSDGENLGMITAGKDVISLIAYKYIII